METVPRMNFVIDHNLNVLLYIVQQFFPRIFGVLITTLVVGIGAPADSLNIYTDFDLFHERDNVNSLEVYYSFNEAELTYIKVGNYFKGGLLINLSVKQQGSQYGEIHRRFQVPHEIADTSNFQSGKTFSSLFKLTIKDTAQELTIDVIDLNDKSRQQTVKYYLYKRNFYQENLMVSDLQLCSSIMRVSQEKSSALIKNSLQLIPNPSRVFTNESPYLYFYVELYNLKDLSARTTVHARTVILDDDHNEVASQSHKINTLSDTDIQFGMIDLKDLTDGKYEIQFLVIDPAQKVIKTSKNIFQIVRKLTTATPSSDLTGKEFMIAQLSTMDEVHLDTEFYALKHLTSRKDVKKYKRLSSINEKIEFLADLWAPFDSNFETVQNESRLQFVERLTYVNSQFAVGLKEGWRTDRGRIFIAYGPPDQYIREPYERGLKPHEEWHYHSLQGGVVFVFADLNGFQDYRLVHSTHQSELQNYNWKSRLQR